MKSMEGLIPGIPKLLAHPPLSDDTPLAIWNPDAGMDGEYEMPVWDGKQYIAYGKWLGRPT